MDKGIDTTNFISNREVLGYKVKDKLDGYNAKNSVKERNSKKEGLISGKKINLKAN